MIPEVGVAEKGGFFSAVCLAVTRFELHKQADRRCFGLEVTAADQRRTIRTGGLMSGEHPDKVRSEQDAAMQPDGMRRTYLLFFSFLARAPPDRGTSLCSKEGRSKAVEE